MLLLFSLVRSEFYFIRLYQTQLFVGTEKIRTAAPTCSNFEQAEVYEVVKSENDAMKFTCKVTSDLPKVFDIAYGKNLVHHPYHGKKNQRMMLQAVNCEGVFNIMYEGKCVTFNRLTTKLNLDVCDPQNADQNFEFLNAKKFSAYILAGGSAGGSGGGAMGGDSGGMGGGLGDGMMGASMMANAMFAMVKEIREGMTHALGDLQNIKLNLMSGSSSSGLGMSSSSALGFARSSSSSMRVQSTLNNVSQLCREFSL